MPFPESSEFQDHVMASGAALRPGAQVGRFELRRMLGQGGQSTVWLAFDPRMEREVALKVLHPVQSLSDPWIGQWLEEARSVGRLSHPHIVALFDADVQGRYPYLVFEYLTGETLDQYVQRRGHLAAVEAASLTVDVLDALAIAHDAGIVHRDIKPANILMDASGRVRIMDFGIAARLWGGGASQVAEGGSLGYLSPEAANGAPPSPSMDIFGAGLVLGEMLAGRALQQETDPYRSVYRSLHEPVTLPKELPSPVDDRLRAIVARALALDPHQRFESARVFQQQLRDWIDTVASSDEAESASHGTLDFLMRRMRHKSDFPALSDAIVRIHSMATSETESVSSVTTEILKDVALTNKLLRLVNSAHYARGGNISTVSRAVTLVGFNGIRNMALSLVLLEHMQDKAHAAQLKEEFLRCLMAGSVAAELCSVDKDSEEAFLGAMFQNLGRLLTHYYFPEEAQQIRQLVHSSREPLTEATAAMRVLGMTLEDLGLGIAKSWGLPLSIQRCMRKPEGKPPTTAVAEPAERLRWVAMVSNDIADTLLHTERVQAEARIDQLTQKFAKAVGSSSREMLSATRRARQKMVELAEAMEIRLTPHSAAARLVHLADEAHHDSAPRGGDSGLAPLALHATAAMPAYEAATPNDATQGHSRVAEVLTDGIQDITNAMVDDFKLSDILRMILETMYRALAFDRVIFCMRDPKTESMTARFGLGAGVETVIPIFKAPLQGAALDLFGVVCQKGADSLISDASEDRIVQRLPAWYLHSIHAPTFLLLPLQIKGATFGLIYADKNTTGGLVLNDKELALLRTLRNQAVMAFKQSN